MHAHEIKLTAVAGLTYGSRGIFSRGGVGGGAAPRDRDHVVL